VVAFFTPALPADQIPPPAPQPGLLRPWQDQKEPNWKGRVDARTEINLYVLECPVCGAKEDTVPATGDNRTATYRNCKTCGMWEARYDAVTYHYLQRLCLVTIAFQIFGDSKRKQIARIKRRDKALAEAKRLFEDKNASIHAFGAIDPDDWQTVAVMADWLTDNDYPLQADACRLMAEARKTKTVMPSLVPPEMKFPVKHANGETPPPVDTGSMEYRREQARLEAERLRQEFGDEQG
jgi:hypothetical protein